jgi:hypothetical protein
MKIVSINPYFVVDVYLSSKMQELTEIWCLTAVNTGALHGTCKFLRQLCVPGCVSAPHFGGGSVREHGAGAMQFAAMHKCSAPAT